MATAARGTTRALGRAMFRRSPERRYEAPPFFRGMPPPLRHPVVMLNIIKRPDWHLPERLMTPEFVFLDRRRFLREMGFASAGLLTAGLVGCSKSESAAAEPKPQTNP